MKEIDVRDLLEHPGSSRTVSLAEPVEGLSAGLAAVPQGAPIEGRLLLESVVEGILVSGALSGRMGFACARCLSGFERQFEVTVRELFVQDPPPGGEEYPLLVGGSLDLEPMVRDAVILTIPFSPLCRADCLGLCERCGGDRNLAQCRCGPAPADPRWAALERFVE